MDSLKRKESPIKMQGEQMVSPPKKRAKKSSDVKKPTSAYFYFVSDYRKVLRKKGKDINQIKEVWFIRRFFNLLIICIY